MTYHDRLDRINQLMGYDDMGMLLYYYDEQPHTHRYRYPVQKSRPRGFMDEGLSLPRESSFTEHEVRYTEGRDTVEIWEGQKMICRIPVIGLQTVLMDELS